MGLVAYGFGKNRSVEDRLKWLLQFSNADLDGLTAGAKLDLWLETQIFKFPFAHLLREDTTVKSLLPSTFQLMRELQADVRQGLEAIQKGQNWVLPEAPSKWTVAATKRDRGKIRVAGIIYDGNLRQMFFATVAELLREGSPLIRVCLKPECKTPFLPHRKQTYCRPECSREVRWKRFTEKPRDRDYHAEYEQTVKKRVGSAKIRVKRKTGIKPRQNLKGGTQNA